MKSSARVLGWLVVVAVLTPACSAAIRPASLASIEDVTTAARVKSVLVNDSEIGVHPIQVHVSNRSVRLSGYVPDTASETRALALARGVPGVADAQSNLSVGGEPPVVPLPDDRPDLAGIPRAADEPGSPSDHRLLAIGGTIGWNGSRVGTLDPAESLGPLVRLGSGSGLGLAVGFGWFGSDLTADERPAEIVGRIRIKPVMGGLGYTVRNEQMSLSVTGVAGLAFNSVMPGEVLGNAVPLGLTNSLAVRPGVSFWFDASGRVAVNVSAGYIVTRPRLSLLEDGEVVRRRLKADTFLLRVGMAYKIF